MRWSEAAIEHVYEELGERIKAARVGLGLTQTEVSQRVGLTRSSIANIEAGRQRAMIHTLMHIANALEASLAELLPDPDQEPRRVSLLDPNELDGWPSSTHDFVNGAIRRAAQR